MKHCYYSSVITVLIYGILDAESSSCVCKEEVEKYLRIFLASSIENYSSCAEIIASRPASPSGVYTLHYEDQTTEKVYCLMDSLPGCGEGGWRRIGYLDLTMADQDCPSELTEFNENGARVCSFPGDGGCKSIFFTTNGQSYSKVCGFVRGYSIGSPDSFVRFGGDSGTNENNINAAYLDGVSVTYGSPRQHLWSYASSQPVSDSFAQEVECPCTLDSTIVDPPSFVGSHYYCESGGGTSNVLWDGQQCTGPESMNDCCNIPELPWFHRVIPNTNDTIELRVCRDEPKIGNEDVPINQYQMYVQ